MDDPSSVEDNEGVVISFVVASNVFFEVECWLWIMGLEEDEEGMDDDGLFFTCWFVNVDGCCLPPPASW